LFLKANSQSPQQTPNSHPSSPEFNPTAMTKSFTIGAPETVREIIQDDKYLQLFAHHLMEDLSTECLLSMIEFTQFKAHLVDKLNVDDVRVREVWFEFAPGAPLSDIVHHIGENEEHCIKSFKLKARELWKKYIVVNSCFEINIRSKMRKKFTALMSNKEQWANDKEINAVELAMVFDDVIMEMKVLMEYSRMRFNSAKSMSISQ